MSGRSKEASAQAVAVQLFDLFVVEDFSVSTRKWSEHYGDTAAFKTDTFVEKLFVYLAASLALALINEGRTKSFALNVLHSLKPLIGDDYRRRWKTLEDPDELVEDAITELARLLFTDPLSDADLSLEWPKEWLHEVCIFELNPLLLFRFSYFWKSHHVCLAKSVALLIQESLSL